MMSEKYMGGSILPDVCKRAYMHGCYRGAFGEILGRFQLDYFKQKKASLLEKLSL